MISDREYVFASSFIKASEGKGTPAERLARFREAQDRENLRSFFAEAFHVGGDDVYDAAMTAATELIKSSLPEFSLFAPLLYKYDCANIKTSIKCKIRDISPEGMLFSCGNYPVSLIIAAAESSDFSKIPGEMGKAAQKALAEYRKTGEVRAIDLTLDRACFADMDNSAKESAIGLIGKIVRLRADSVNLITLMRINEGGFDGDTAVSLFGRAFVPGGNMPESAFLTKEGTVADKETAASRASGDTAEIIKAAAKSADADAAAKIVDEAIIKECMKYRFKPFGPEVAVSLLVIREAEITNCRIIEAAMGEADREEVLRERLRVAYV